MCTSLFQLRIVDQIRKIAQAQPAKARSMGKEEMTRQTPGITNHTERTT